MEKIVFNKKNIIAFFIVSQLAIFCNSFAESKSHHQILQFTKSIQNTVYDIQNKIVFHNFVSQPMLDPNGLRAIAHVVDAERFNHWGLKICGEIKKCFVQFPPAGGKNLTRAKEKANRSGGYQYVLDFSRMTIVVDYKNTLKVINSIISIWKKNNIVWIKDRINHSLSGYRDIQVYVKDPKTKLISEILIISPAMSEAKYHEGHKFYEKIRSLQAKAAFENRPLSTQEKIKIAAYGKAMQQLYDNAHANELNKLQ